MLSRKIPAAAAAFLIIILFSGCAGTQHSYLKMGAGIWQASLKGDATETAYDEISGTPVITHIGFDSNEWVDVDSTLSAMRADILAGSGARFRFSVWDMTFDGKAKAHGDFTVFDTTFLATEEVTGEFKFMGGDVAGEFNVIPLDFKDISIGIYAGVGAKYIRPEIIFEGETETASKGAHAPVLFVSAGGDAALFDYFSGGVRFDMMPTFLIQGLLDEQGLDMSFNEMKIYGGFSWPLKEIKEDGQPVSKIGVELGYVKNSLDLSHEEDEDESGNPGTKYEAKLGFSGVYFQVVFSY